MCMQPESSRAKLRDPVAERLSELQRDPSTSLGMAVSVISAGFQTTLQDCGRIGLRKFGVAPGGALDSFSLRLANLLVGNSGCTAGLECSSGKIRLRFHDERLLAWAGGEFEIRVGDQLVPILHCARVGKEAEVQIVSQRGRAWLAISGGINVPEILGSRSSDLRAHFGGWTRPTLCSGDELPLGPESKLCSRLRNKIPEHVSDWSGPRFVCHRRFLRIIRGKNWDEEIGNKLLSQKFRVGMNSDRMGLRLEDAQITTAGRRELVSEAVAPGTVQLPPSGAPIVLLQGCQTIGGYPKIAHVITVDLACAAQLQPLDEVRFQVIELEQARELLRERERDIALFRVGLEARFG